MSWRWSYLLVIPCPYVYTFDFVLGIPGSTHELSVLTLAPNATLSIGVEVLHGRFISEARQLLDSVSVSKVVPERASVGTNQLFLMVYST